MTQEQLQWIEDNKLIFTSNVSVPQETALKVYEIYNTITNENKKPNGCGRCWVSVKKRVLKHYLDLGNLF
tara:strand:- start:4680 stop:4889 length:210 start_codon:yes stop_codon:yes gene_type:complete